MLADRPAGRPWVKAYQRPYDSVYDRYSAYYRIALRDAAVAAGGTYVGGSMGRYPELIRGIRKVRELYRLRPLYERMPVLGSSLDRLAHTIEGELKGPDGVLTRGVAQFEVQAKTGRKLRVVVDANDDGADLEQVALDWSDVYFKTNYWPSIPYAPKIRPIVNGDPAILPRIREFRGYRDAVKKYDLCMIVRVWGGRNEVEGVEHSLRLIEAVARAKGSKFLYAYLVAGDVEKARARLERQSIPCGTRPIRPNQLWEVTAASRLNIVRLGMHYCIPWRVTGALALGSAMVLDRAPLTLWPEPLRDGEHYKELSVDVGKDKPIARDEEYAAIPHKLDAWLADRDLWRRMGAHNGSYFDRFMVPQAVGDYVLRTVEEVAAPPGPGTTRATTAGAPSA